MKKWLIVVVTLVAIVGTRAHAQSTAAILEDAGWGIGDNIVWGS